MYSNPEVATIVAIQKRSPLNSVRQMYITVRLRRRKKEMSFCWASSPTIITENGIFANKAPADFERFWDDDDLIGKTVKLYNADDESLRYMTFSD